MGAIGRESGNKPFYVYDKTEVYNKTETYSAVEVDAKDAIKLNVSAYTASDVLAKVKTVDGSGSGLDADLLRGLPADFTSSKATSGYQKLPSGLIIQWGNAPAGANNLGITSLLPIAFPNAAYISVATHNGNGAVNSYISATHLVNLNSIYLATNYGVDIGASYIAIGH